MDESEIYVRDYLLIQFMTEYYLGSYAEIEEIYKKWIDWLKRMEEKNDKRSTV